MKFLIDTMCGGLRSYLRICGYDAAYALDRGIEADERLLEWAREENRTVITRDRQLASRADPDPGAILLTEREVVDQLRELAAAGVALDLAERPSRCGRCNGRLEVVEAGRNRPDYVPDDEDPVWQCRDCGQQFWKGSHWDDVRETLEGIGDDK